MMKKFTLMMLCLAALGAGQVHSATWQLLDSSSGNEFKLYIDTTNMTTVTTIMNKTYPQAWFKNEVIRDINLEDQLVVGDYMLNLWRFDCTAHTLGLSKSVRYKKDGTFLEEITVPVPIMNKVIPSTAGDLMWSARCLGTTMHFVEKK